MRETHREEYISKLNVETQNMGGVMETTVTMLFNTGREFVNRSWGGIDHPYENLSIGDRVWATLLDDKVIAVRAF